LEPTRGAFSVHQAIYDLLAREGLVGAQKPGDTEEFRRGSGDYRQPVQAAES